MDPTHLDPTYFAIRWNTVAVNDPCAVCGARTDPNEGYELMLVDSNWVVCDDCGRRYAPGLVTMLELYRARPDAHAAEYAMKEERAKVLHEQFLQQNRQDEDMPF